MESIKQKVPQIKICGITQDEEIQWLNEADVSYAGFVLYEKSCRYIPISKTQELFEKLNDNIKKVAVAVNPDVTMVKQVMDAGFDILQVHGNLTEEVLAVTEIPVWRAVNLTDANIFEELVREYRDLSIDEKITALLMDAKEFGSGKNLAKNCRRGDSIGGGFVLCWSKRAPPCVRRRWGNGYERTIGRGARAAALLAEPDRAAARACAARRAPGAV